MKKTSFIVLLFLFISWSFITEFSFARDEKVVKPKEYGVYVKTKGSLIRVLPNIVFDVEGILFIESNNPKTFQLKDVQYFVVYGEYDMDVLTLNPLLFFQTSPLGKPRYIFGKDIEIVIKKQNIPHLYTVKPKGLLGRGYYCLWINDSAWDFIIE